jgi:hypothetical protein
MKDEGDAVGHSLYPSSFVLSIHPFPLPPRAALPIIWRSQICRLRNAGVEYANMRRRTLLLAAGLLAYFIGATVRVYLRPAEELHGFEEAGDRIIAVARHPREALRHPLLAAGFILFKEGCS